MKVSVLGNGTFRTLVMGLFGPKTIVFPDAKKIIRSGHIQQVGSGNPKHTYFVWPNVGCVSVERLLHCCDVYKMVAVAQPLWSLGTKDHNSYSIHSQDMRTFDLQDFGQSVDLFQGLAIEYHVLDTVWSHYLCAVWDSFYPHKILWSSEKCQNFQSFLRSSYLGFSHHSTFWLSAKMIPSFGRLWSVRYYPGFARIRMSCILASIDCLISQETFCFTFSSD